MKMEMEDNNPLVTVVVPAYNHEDYIEECVDSILGQGYNNIELFVINDGSTDGTHEKMLNVCGKYGDRIKYINKENEGLITSLNIALNEGSGKYFCELASDDSWVEGSLKKRVDFLEKNKEYGAVFGDIYYVVDGVKTDKRLVGHVKYGGYDSKKHTVKHLLEVKRMIVFPTGLFKRETLLGLGGFDSDFKYFEDVSMRYKLVSNVKVGHIDEPLLWYRKHSNNVSSSSEHFIRMKEESILTLEKLFESTEDIDIKVTVTEKLFKRYMGYVKLGFKNNINKNKIREALNKALAIKPFSIKARIYSIIV